MRDVFRIYRVERASGRWLWLVAEDAEAGDFDAAVKWEEKALGLWQDQKELEKGRARLELYRAKKPDRDPPLDR